MLEMFKNFDNTPIDYKPDNRPRPVLDSKIINKTTSLAGLYPIYNIKDEILGFGWNYGNAISIPINIRGEVVDEEGNSLTLQEYLQGKVLQVTFYNFLYEEVLSFLSLAEFEETTENVDLEIKVDKETSLRLQRGIYHLQIEIDDVIIYSPHDSVIMIK